MHLLTVFEENCGLQFVIHKSAIINLQKSKVIRSSFQLNLLALEEYLSIDKPMVFACALIQK